MQDVLHVNSDFKLYALLHETRDAIYRVREKELRQFGIRPRQAAVLFVIDAIGDKATPAEISRWLFRQSHTISGLLKRMERDGLIRMVKDLDRKNLVRVALTEKGQQALDQSRKREAIHYVMSTLSLEEQQQLSSSLDKLLSRALINLGIEGKLPFP